MSTATVKGDVLREAALTICGRREGKTKSCSSCLRKADAIVSLAKSPALNTKLVPRIADIVCGSDGRPCVACWDKATTLLLELRP
ncbi:MULTISPECIES: hypothetical protein [unclassified Streptomyces]|uniref:hypothetical protein n=1 Tax=unclassified Streptomyces TaxID=2593676 RepID=UPI0035DCAAEA